MSDGRVKAWTIRELRFRDCFLLNGNATQAFIDAGYKAPNRREAASKAYRLMKGERMKMLLQPIMNAKLIAPDRIQELIAQKIESMPEDEFTHDHWIRLVTLQARIHGMLKEAGNKFSVGTLNLLQVRGSAPQLPVDASQSENERESVIDVQDAVEGQ